MPRAYFRRKEHLPEKPNQIAFQPGEPRATERIAARQPSEGDELRWMGRPLNVEVPPKGRSENSPDGRAAFLPPPQLGRGEPSPRPAVTHSDDHVGNGEFIGLRRGRILRGTERDVTAKPNQESWVNLGVGTGLLAKPPEGNRTPARARGASLLVAAPPHRLEPLPPHRADADGSAGIPGAAVNRQQGRVELQEVGASGQIGRSSYAAAATEATNAFSVAPPQSFAQPVSATSYGAPAMGSGSSDGDELMSVYSAVQKDLERMVLRNCEEAQRCFLQLS